MPSVSVTLPDIEQLVVRPSVYQVIEQVRDILDMTDDAEVVYAGKRGVIRSANSAISENNLSNEAKFATDDLLRIEVVEKYEPEAVQEANIHSYDNSPVFRDSKIGLTLRPIYLPSRMEITFEFQSASDTEVSQWIATQMMKCSRGRDTHLHHVIYQFPIPYAFIYILNDVHKLREKTDGYGETLFEYFNRHRVKRITALTDQGGEKMTSVVREKQAGIVGTFDFTVFPDKPEFDKEKGLWRARFVYSFLYWRPDGFYIEYPIAVHNSFMPDIYIKDLENVVEYQTEKAYYSHGMNALSMFSSSNWHPSEATRFPHPLLRIPSFDPIDPEVKKGTATAFIARCFLDDTLQDLISLYELGDYEIDPDILDFFKTEYRWMTQLYHSTFHVEHYINGMLQPQDNLEVTPELMVRSKTKLSKRDQHHVRLAGLPEINRPLFSALKRVSEHPRAFVKVVSCFNELLAKDPDFNSLINYTRIEPWMYSEIFNMLAGMSSGAINSTGNGRNDYVFGSGVGLSKDALPFLTGLDPEYIKIWLNEKLARPFSSMNSYIIVHRKKDVK